MCEQVPDRLWLRIWQRLAVSIRRWLLELCQPPSSYFLLVRQRWLVGAVGERWRASGSFCRIEKSQRLLNILQNMKHLEGNTLYCLNPGCRKLVGYSSDIKLYFISKRITSVLESTSTLRLLKITKNRMEPSDKYFN